MLFVFNLEILVADDIVVEEARCQLAGERKAAQPERIDLGFGERGRGFLNKSLGERPIDIEVHARLVGFGRIFFDKVCRKTDCVAEIVTDQTRHDGIQVDDDQSLARRLVKENVIDLRVIMGDAERELAFRVQIRQLASRVFHRQQPVKLLAHLCNAPADIRFHVFP